MELSEMMRYSRSRHKHSSHFSQSLELFAKLLLSYQDIFVVTVVSSKISCDSTQFLIDAYMCRYSFWSMYDINKASMVLYFVPAWNKDAAIRFVGVYFLACVRPSVRPSVLRDPSVCLTMATWDGKGVSLSPSLCVLSSVPIRVYTKNWVYSISLFSF